MSFCLLGWQDPAVEYLRGFSDYPHPLVLPLGLVACLHVLLDYGIVELRNKRTGICLAGRLDIFHRQIYQNVRPLYSVSRGFPPATALDWFWLPAWLHQAPWPSIYKRCKFVQPTSRHLRHSRSEGLLRLATFHVPCIN